MIRAAQDSKYEAPRRRQRTDTEPIYIEEPLFTSTIESAIASVVGRGYNICVTIPTDTQEKLASITHNLWEATVDNGVAITCLKFKTLYTTKKTKITFWCEADRAPTVIHIKHAGEPYGTVKLRHENKLVEEIVKNPEGDKTNATKRDHTERIEYKTNYKFKTIALYGCRQNNFGGGHSKLGHEWDSAGKQIKDGDKGFFKSEQHTKRACDLEVVHGIGTVDISFSFCIGSNDPFVLTNKFAGFFFMFDTTTGQRFRSEYIKVSQNPKRCWKAEQKLVAVE